jgi:hypothetical protein
MTRSSLHRSSSAEREPCCRTGMPKERGAIQSVAWRRNERLQSMRKNLSAVAADLPAALLTARNSVHPVRHTYTAPRHLRPRLAARLGEDHPPAYGREQRLQVTFRDSGSD